MPSSWSGSTDDGPALATRERQQSQLRCKIKIGENADMVPNAFKPSDTQARVLKWIYDGCPDDVVWKGYANRTASRVLSDRGLVVVEGKGNDWSVSLTDAGRRYLEEHVFGPARMHEDAGRLLEAVARAGGTLLVDVKIEKKDYKPLVDAANGHPGRVRGKKLSLHPVGPYGTPIRALTLEPNWEEVAADRLRDVPIRALPSTRGKVQDAGISDYIKTQDWHYVSPELVKRAARILHQIRLEADRRGWTSKMRGDLGAKYEGVRRDGQLKLFPPNAEVEIKIREVPVRGARRLTAEEKSSHKIPQWIKDRQVCFQGTGQLELRWGFRSAQDSAETVLEQQLPRLFALTEVDCLVRAERELARSGADDLVERHMQQLQLMVGAAQPAQHQWAEFEKRFTDWQRVAPMRAFLHELLEVSATMEAMEREAHEIWLSSVSNRLDAMDPLVTREPPPCTGMATREEVYAYIRGD